jgi:hypothetical protein
MNFNFKVFYQKFCIVSLVLKNYIIIVKYIDEFNITLINSILSQNYLNQRPLKIKCFINKYKNRSKKY